MVIFQNLFGVSQERYSDDLSLDALDEWDSIQHLTLILTLEQVFKVRFSPEQYGKLTSVRAIKNALGA